MKAAYLGLLALLLLASAAQADPRLWGDDGIAVRAGTFLHWQGASAMDETGNTLFVWADVQNGSPDIRAQLVSPAGAELWTPGGMTVCGEAHRQAEPAVCRVSDGWIVAWSDARTPPFASIYAQKLNASGDRQWSANNFSGVCVYAGDAATNYFYPYLAVIPGGVNGAFIAWSDEKSRFRRYSGAASHERRRGELGAAARCLQCPQLAGQCSCGVRWRRQRPAGLAGPAQRQ